jgi:hypothetical protein
MNKDSLRVEWDENNQVLSVNGFLISGQLLLAMASDPIVPGRPWMVTDRKDGMIFAKSVKLCDCQAVPK